MHRLSFSAYLPVSAHMKTEPSPSTIWQGRVKYKKIISWPNPIKTSNFMKIQGLVAEHQIREAGEEKSWFWACDISAHLDLLCFLVWWGHKESSIVNGTENLSSYWIALEDRLIKAELKASPNITGNLLFILYDFKTVASLIILLP